jgi:hypothetical protein
VDLEKGVVVARLRRWVRPVARLVWAGVAVAASHGCGGSNVGEGRALAEACSLNSDCAGKLLCAFGTCRTPCVTSADCSGGSCVTDGKNAVCQTAKELETPCAGPASCVPPLDCAADYRCRNLCRSDSDCNVLGITGRVCAEDAQGVEYCADPTDVSDAGATIVALAPPGAPEASVVEPVSDAAGIEAGVDEVTIGSAGGTFGTGSLVVSVPPGAVDHDVTITIAPIDSPAPGAVGQAYEIGPTGTQFRIPILVTLSYAAVDAGVAPQALSVSTIVGGAWQAVSAPIFDPITATVGGTTTHLSPYALAANQSSTSTAGDASTMSAVPEAGTSDGAASDSPSGGATDAAPDRTVQDSGPACAVVPTGIVSWWPGEGNSNDFVGQNALTGTVTYTTGIVGQAFHFQNSYLTGTALGLPTANAARTIEGWVRAQSSTAQGEALIAGYGLWGATDGTNLLTLSQNNELTFDSWGTQNVIATAPTLQANTWTHVAVVVNQGAAALYVNGTLVFQGAATVNTPTAQTATYLGGFPNPPDGVPEYFTGDVDEVSVYSVALTATQLQAIHAAGIAGKCKQ